MQPETTQPAETGRETGNGTAGKLAPLVPGGRLLTNSRLATRRRCAREHHLRFDLGYLPLQDEDAPRRFGSLLHLGLEFWWRWHMAPDTGTALASALLALPEDADPYDLAKARALLIGYDARWLDAMEDIEVLSVEVELTPVPIVNPVTGRESRTWLIGGKLDAYVRRISTNQRLLVEHKTTSLSIDPGSTYWRRLKIDAQVSTYFAATDVEGCIYDVIVRPGTRPAKATAPESRKYTKDGRLYANQREADETPEEFFNRLVEAIGSEPDRYYARGDVVRLDGEIREHMADVWGIAQTIREDHKLQRWPRNADGCERYGKMCAFFDVCTGSASLDDRSLFQRTDRVHRELAVIPS